jgi:hypothetical protein
MRCAISTSMSAIFHELGIDTMVCEATDVDGDKRLSTFSLASDGSLTRESVAGTGKYEGMMATGAIHPLVRFRSLSAERFRTAIIKPARTS